MAFVLCVVLSGTPNLAQISGHHNVVLDPTAKPSLPFRTGIQAYHLSHSIARPYYGPDGFLGRNSIFLFGVSFYNAIYL